VTAVPVRPWLDGPERTASLSRSRSLPAASPVIAGVSRGTAAWAQEALIGGWTLVGDDRRLVATKGAVTMSGLNVLFGWGTAGAIVPSAFHDRRMAGRAHLVKALNVLGSRPVSSLTPFDHYAAGRGMIRPWPTSESCQPRPARMPGM
jgi:hypothetical protein